MEFEGQTINPKVIKRFSVPVGLVVRRKQEVAKSENASALMTTTFLNLVMGGTGKDSSPESSVEKTARVGISRSTLYALRMAGRWGLQLAINSAPPQAPGEEITTRWANIAASLDRIAFLRSLTGNEGAVSPLDVAVLREYLKTGLPEETAAAVNGQMCLPAPLTGHMIGLIVRKYEGKVDCLFPARLPRRSLAARQVLKNLGTGNFELSKARITEKILTALEGGAKVGDMVGELSLPDHRHYHILLTETCRDLEEDSQGLGDLTDIYRRVIGKEWYPGIKLNSTQTQLMFRSLLAPYNSLRQRLQQTTTLGISPREKQMLGILAQGGSNRAIARALSAPENSMAVIIKWLLEEQPNAVTRTKRLQERQEVFAWLQNNVPADNLRMYQGIPLAAIMKYLAEGCTFKEVSEQIRKEQDVIIPPDNVSFLYDRARAEFYKGKLYK